VMCTISGILNTSVLTLRSANIYVERTDLNLYKTLAVEVGVRGSSDPRAKALEGLVLQYGKPQDGTLMPMPMKDKLDTPHWPLKVFFEERYKMWQEKNEELQQPKEVCKAILSAKAKWAGQVCGAKIPCKIHSKKEKKGPAAKESAKFKIPAKRKRAGSGTTKGGKRLTKTQKLAKEEGEEKEEQKTEEGRRKRRGGRKW